MSIVVRINISSKLKNSASEIGYYSYTNRYGQLKLMPKKLEQTEKRLKTGVSINY